MWLLKGKPYEVQTKALSLASGRRGFGYYMEMGLGKTATVYNEFLTLLEMDLVDIMVIICPQSLKQVWVSEADKWGVNIPITVWPIPARGAKDPIKPIFIINYEAIIGRGGEFLEELISKNRVYMAMDESIHVKNPSAQRTKRLIAINNKVEYIRTLSGAPIVKSSLDIWGQFRCMGLLKGFNSYAFRNRFCVMGGYLGKQIVGVRNQEELSQLLEENSFRALKKDWTDLPETLNGSRNYEMKGEQLRQYEIMRKELVVHINDESISAPMVITQMMKLQQISGGFIIDEEAKVNLIVPKKDNIKLKITKEFVSELDNKIIIFAFYRQSVMMLIESFPDFATLVGGQSSEEQQEQKDSFNIGDAPGMIAQFTAGKYGHTLLGTEKSPCHTTLFYENNYDLDARIQAEARNHRHGQHYPVTYVDLIGTTLDGKIIAALRKKQALADSIVDAVRESGR